ncbi:MAG: hypothetical protein V4534_02105 [Myxococcota bacterium]
MNLVKLLIASYLISLATIAQPDKPPPCGLSVYRGEAPPAPQDRPQDVPLAQLLGVAFATLPPPMLPRTGYNDSSDDESGPRPNLDS